MKRLKEAEDGDLLQVDEINSYLPLQLSNLITFFLNRDLVLTLVGGCVRDFFLTGKFSRDFDFELQSFEKQKDEKWRRNLKNIAKDLAVEGYCVEELSFSVLRIKKDNLSVEIAPARVEQYQEKTEVLGHSDFTVKLMSKTSYRESFKRRDFTMNAMGVEFKKAEKYYFVDPFNGREAIDNQVLRSCHEQFFLDPVRFLRLIRFKNKFDLKMDENLKKNLHHFSLEKLSLHHLFKEALKSHFLYFFDSFFKITKDFNISYKKEWDLFKVFSHVSEKEIKFTSLMNVFVYSLYQNHKGGEDFFKVAKALGLKEKKARSHEKLFDLLIELKDLDIDAFQEKAKKTDLLEVLKWKSLLDINKAFVLINDFDEDDFKELNKKANPSNQLRLSLKKLCDLKIEGESELILKLLSKHKLGQDQYSPLSTLSKLRAL